MDSLNYHRPRALEVTLALAFPSTSTWSRARASSKEGPPVLRSLVWPWGAPGLGDTHRAAVEADNRHFRLATAVCETLRSASRPWIFSFPEQFASTAGEPSPTPWDTPELRIWARRWRLWRSAAYQCEFGASRSRPTGLLTNISFKDSRLRPGWPILRVRDDGTAEYSGPLPHKCSCADRHAPIPQRMSGAPWDLASLCSVLEFILRKAECRGLLSGKGNIAATASQKDFDLISLDSETTVEEPSSPAEATGLERREASTDQQLCAALNIREDCFCSLARFTSLHSASLPLFLFAFLSTCFFVALIAIIAIIAIISFIVWAGAWTSSATSTATCSSPLAASHCHIACSLLPSSVPSTLCASPALSITRAMCSVSVTKDGCQCPRCPCPAARAWVSLFRPTLRCQQNMGRRRAPYGTKEAGWQRALHREQCPPGTAGQVSKNCTALDSL